MFSESSLPAAQQVHDSCGVTPCIFMNDAVLYHQVWSFSPEFMRLRSPHQSEKNHCEGPGTTQEMNLPVLQGGQYGTPTKMDALMVYDAFQTFGKRWWIREIAILKVHKYCTPVNKAMSEIMTCCHYFLFTLVLGGEGWLGFPDFRSGQKPWSNWYLTPLVNFDEVRRAQLAKSTFLISTMVTLGSFQIF